MQNLVWIFISAFLINNFTLTYFLGLCAFFGVTQKIDTSIRLGIAITFVMTITALCVYPLTRWVLPHAPYLQMTTFIIVIASAVQFVEMAIKKLSPELFKTLGIYLPLITTNCALLAVALFTVNKGYGFIEGIVYAIGAGMGVTLAYVMLAGVREEYRLSNIPKIIRGTAINMIIAGILSMAFMGFAGLFSSH
jgi:electron transport complex protein RnfA